ncbi:MAG TPA: hypothetical protein VMJ90_06295 [Anaerolineales bacterium]|nr:hypothetical protein [Anaerolineales bacterium]
MHLDAILEVIIGLVTTWLVISVATSQIQAFVTDLFGVRSSFLKNQINGMFSGDGKTVDELYNHGLIRSLETTSFFGSKRKPAKIPGDIFAKAAVDLFLTIPETNAGKPLYQAIRTLSPNVDPGAMEAVGKLDEYRRNVQEWFEAAMSKASDIYRRNITVTAFVIGLVLAYLFNVDTVYIANKLWTQPTLRQAIVAQAGNLNPNDEVGLNNTLAKINSMSLPVGWTADASPQTPRDWYSKYLGWFITGLAGLALLV